MQAITQLVLDENNIAFHPMMGNSYQLNDISKEILLLLRENKSKQEVVELLLERYDTTYNELFIDVSDFYSKLKIYGLLG
ncbi:PqqD family protein [Sulfurimonas sp. SAG-AH-194-L11]|nr:PqqD family protein [Sulfurimonas sp. SAG-AH-194-L11]MDF1876336.1 PqqD family protein [Sulfurimonas sp. SAG-AH-194-L11]